MSESGDPLAECARAMSASMWREEMALFCLGPKGAHFAGDEWEARADALASDPAAYLREPPETHV